MNEVANPPQAAGHAFRWKWLLALGAILLVLGLAGISVATLLQLTSLLVFGPMLLASSILQMLTALFVEKRKESLLHLAAAVLEMALGFFIMANPLERVVDLVTLIAVFFVVIGLVRLARSLAMQSGGRVWIFVTGSIAVLLGIAVWIGGPAAKVGFVALCIAADFLFHGASWLALALMERKAVQQPVS